MNNFENIETLKKFNKSYITLVSLPVCLIPKIVRLLNLILAIYFEIKGNTWALKNKKFSYYQFY